MKRLLLSALFCLTLVLFAPLAHADDTPAMALVRAFYATLSETMKEGPKLGFDGRVKKLEPAVTKTFNLPLMARTAVGLGWSKESPEDQQKLIDAFSRFSVATYASRFTKSDGEVFEVIGEKPASGGGVMVETKLILKEGDAVTLNYLVRNDAAGEPRVMDVYLDAAISELATRRSEFGAVIKRQGFEALVDSLAEKAKKMGQSKQG